MSTRIGVDVGGTFTDVVVYDASSGTITVAKEPTTADAPDIGVLRAVHATASSAVIAASRYFLHATTVGLNAIVQREGAKVALLTTSGFRDVLEIRHADRAEMYNLFWKAPPPLVPRRLRLPISERMRANGQVHRPFDEATVRDVIPALRRAGIEAVAVAFLNSYVNPAHEIAAERVLRECGFDGEVSLSHKVSGEWREYERTCTTVIDAFMRGRLAQYLDLLETALRESGFQGQLFLTRAGGGALTFADAKQRPFETVTSGPVAGAQGAAEIATVLGLDEVITADVGGTSFDTCVIVDGQPETLYEGEIAGMPVQTEWVDVRSIGAGGGSIAYVDGGGLLKVGPLSAGATPGPASYGRGGSAPTVTDAALLLGMLGRGELAGNLKLDRDLAAAAFKPLCARLALDEQAVARGVVTIAAAAMGSAIREITIERGRDPRQASLLAFGGAGPLFATLLSSDLGLRQAVIPPFAGSFSAWGLLAADLVRTLTRTVLRNLATLALGELNDMAVGLWEDALRTSREVSAECVPQIRLDMRYVGQSHSLTIPVPTAADCTVEMEIAALRSAFVDQYARTFGHAMEGDIEIVNVRVTLRIPVESPPGPQAGPTKGQRGMGASVDAYSFTAKQFLTFRLVARDQLASTEMLSGPAVIHEATATTYLDQGFTAHTDAAGCLTITAG